MARNKKRTVFITVGLVVAIALISSMFISTNQLSHDYLLQELGTVSNDYVVTTNSNASSSTILTTLGTLQDKVPEFDCAYGLYSYFTGAGLFQPEPSFLNWSQQNSTSASALTNQTNLIGFSHEFWNSAEGPSRFMKSLSLEDGVLNSTSGVAIDYVTAARFNLTVGTEFCLSDINFAAWAANQSSYHDDIHNISVTGIFAISSYDGLNQFFTGMSLNTFTGLSAIIIGDFATISGYSDNFSSIFPGNSNNLPTGNLPYIYNEQVHQVFYNVILKHESLAVTDQASFNIRATAIESAITTTMLGANIIVSVQNNLLYISQQIGAIITEMQVLLLLVSLPVLLLGWYLVKINFGLSFNGRRREIGLLKSRGASTGQIKRRFYLEALICGLIGGAVGIILGNFCSGGVLLAIYPVNLPAPSSQSIVQNALTFQYATPTAWLWGIAGGVFLSILAVRGPLNEFVALDAVQAIAKYNENVQAQIAKKKSDWVLFVVGIYPLALAYVTQILESANVVNTFSFMWFLNQLSSVLLPISPFILIYATVKILLGRSLSTFTRIINRLTSFFSKPIALFSSKSIIRNQARSARLVFIVAIAIGFTVMALTVSESEIAYQNSVKLLNTASGDPVLYQASNSNNAAKLRISAYQYLQSQSSQLNISGLNLYIPMDSASFPDLLPNTNGIPLGLSSPYSNYGAALITSRNYSQFAGIPDKWFVGDTSAGALAKLATVPNATIIPQAVAKLGYNINDSIRMDYTTSNGTSVEIKLIVVGIYTAFPFTTSFSYGAQMMLIDNTTIADTSFNRILFIAYPEFPQSPSNDSLIGAGVGVALTTFDPEDGYVIPLGQISEQDVPDITQIILQYLNIEIYFLLLIVALGIGVIMYISVHEKSHDLGILRARGVEKSVIYKIQMIEGGILIFLGLLFSLIGIVGAQAIVMELFTLLSGFTSFQPELVIPWISILSTLLISLAGFIVVIALAVKIELRHSDITRIAELLRMA